MALSAVAQPWYVGQKGGLTHAEIRSRAKALLSNDTYLANLEKALIDRTISPAVEVLLYHYAYGKPADTVNVNVSHDDLSQLSLEDLQKRASAALDALKDAQAMQDALDAQFSKTP